MGRRFALVGASIVLALLAFGALVVVSSRSLSGEPIDAGKTDDQSMSPAAQPGLPPFGGADDQESDPVLIIPEPISTLATPTPPAASTAVVANVTTAEAADTSPGPLQSNDLRLYLLSNGSGGNHTSSDILPFGIDAPSGRTANFDNDRDGGPGILIQRDTSGPSTTDTAKFQDWQWALHKPGRLFGRAKLQIWVAAKDFETGETVGVRAGLDVCDEGCSTIGTGSWSGPAAGDFVAVSLDLGLLDVVVEEGDSLRVRVAVPDDLASTDVWIAFGSGEHPSVLRIG